MQDELKAWCNSAVPKTLWHYTDVRAMLSILESGRMRATDALFMNDKEDFIHARKIVVNEAEKLFEDGESPVVRKWCIETVNRFFNAGAVSDEQMQVFVVSLTAHTDSLCQWDRYADSSKGVALGFDLTDLRPNVEIDTLVTFAPCIYEEEKKVSLIRESLHAFSEELIKISNDVGNPEWAAGRIFEWNKNHPDRPFLLFREAFTQWNQEYINHRVQSFAARFAGELLRLCALCKHSGFREEGEWRLALPVHRAKILVNAERKIRQRGDESVPYMDTRLSFDDEDNLPITQIMLGPLYESAPFTVQEVTSETKEILISKSQIPYRRAKFTNKPKGKVRSLAIYMLERMLTTLKS